MPRPTRTSADAGKARLAVSAAVAIVLIALIAGLAGQDLSAVLRALTGETPQGDSGTSAGAESADAAEARRLLEGVPTAEPRPRGDYERDEFGSSWVDTDDNGCSTRNDVLARDLTGARADGDCKVLDGVLDDPYTGERLQFTAEDPQAVQIDHVVPLSLAWRMGAADWDRDRRVEFANDPRNLIAADGPANSAKGDSGPGEWRPHAAFHCAYAVTYIDVTHRYGLPLAAEDHAGLDAMLGACA